MRKQVVLLSMFFSMAGFAQTKNFVPITEAMSDDELVEIAAKITPSPQQLRWQRLELTGFIHFGINTFTEKEWGNGKEDPKIFNPSELDARQWVGVLKDAGIKQVIITAKHHDGFCLWPTGTTQHSVKNSPWKQGKGDVVKDVSDACKELGVGFGVYLSPWDMNNASYGTDAYNDFFLEQLTELLTQYGKVDEIWFDGANGEGPNGKKQVYDFERWYAHIRKLQPQAVIAISGPDVRWVGTETGHGREQEWSVVPVGKKDKFNEGSQTKADMPPSGNLRGQVVGSRSQLRNGMALKWYPAEMDVSIRPGWFYHKDQDLKVKTAEYLKEIYFHSVGRNGVLLLNIPPDKRGQITDYDIKTLKEWKSMLDTIFKINLLKDAKGIVPKKMEKLVDGNDQTHISFKMKNNNNVVEMNLKGEKKFNVLLLQENITVGQRVEKFVFEYWENNSWKQAAEGTTIGFKRLLEFPTVKTSKVRLRIIEARLEPTIAEIGLYFDKDLKN
ncbi:alpha-L-fucosidase [uncultured Flavobacterium sp.]|uniref:alpha-L-fucosidase n=1 Tax=uncultured Flavobacterium sp. TaxID=165435 RepID=UPI0025D0B131|nr:alpha-L-fucosidase [uncultured Flavobacterium sp.]